MALLAAYIANLAGAAPVEEQKSTPASASGGGGVFAALLAATGTAQAAEGEAAPILKPFELPVDPAGKPVTTQASVPDNALGEALTQGLGLPRDGGDIEAAIIGLPAEGDAPRVNPIVPVAVPDADVPIQPPQDGKTPTPDPQRPPVEPRAPAPDTLLQNTPSAPTAQPGEQSVTKNSAGQAGAQQQPGVSEQASATAAPRQTGPENAANRASQTGQENGLQVALDRTAQPIGPQRPQGMSPPPPTANRGDDIPLNPRNPGQRPAVDVDNPAAGKPGDARPQFAVRGPEMVKTMVQQRTGQTLIQIQERSSGDIPIATNPPTLTVSVLASAASPGPASANAPHVPVSALAVQIATQANNGVRRFEIRLDPPELGRIEVRLEVARDGQVMTHLVVERSETLDLLQRDARQLERALQDAGLDTSEEDMKFSLKDQGLTHGDKDQAEGDEDLLALTDSDDNDLAGIPNEPMPPPIRYMATTGLDIRI